MSVDGAHAACVKLPHNSIHRSLRCDGQTKLAQLARPNQTAAVQVMAVQLVVPLLEEGDAEAVVALLQSWGVAVAMVSGDHERAAHSFAAELSIPPSRVRAGGLPAGELDAIW